MLKGEGERCLPRDTPRPQVYFAALAAYSDVMRINMKPAIRALIATSFFFAVANVSAACFEKFEDLFSAVDSDDKALKENSGGFYIEELLLDEGGNLKEKRKLSNVPEKYMYKGRVYPSKSIRDAQGISVYIRRAVLNDVRVVTEKYKDGSEPSSYWFWRDSDGCWGLRSRAINVEQ